MGDAALKLARRALAGGGGTESCANAVNVLNYYVEREKAVASDKRVWAALHYLYTQLDDEAGSRRCLKKIDALGAETRKKKRQSVPHITNTTTNTTTTTTPFTPTTQALPSEMCGGRRTPSPESKSKFMARFEEKRVRSRELRTRGNELFDSTNTRIDQQQGQYSYAGKVDGLLRKSQLLQARGRLLVEASRVTETSPTDNSILAFEGSTQGAA